MTAPATVTADPLPETGIPLTLRYFDCVLVLAFVPFGLLAGITAAGVLGGAGIWIGQRALGALIDGYAAGQDDFRRAMGLTFAGRMLRPLLLGLTILALGQLGEKEDGLVAALIALAAFTVYMILSVIFRPTRTP
jgi:hypothetical protein